MIIFNATDLLSILFLVFMEGVLSVDNALALAVVVRHLPRSQHKKALTYGIWGAFAFRFISLFLITQIMRTPWIQAAGAIYLLWICFSYFILGGKDENNSLKTPGGWNFWKTVLIVECVDISFSIDSILAAASLTLNYWIIVIGGVLGILMMRLAASAFIWLIERFPRLETTAYMLIGVIGAKLLTESFRFDGIDFHSSQNAASWLFWFAMAGTVLVGFIKPKRIKSQA